MGAMGDLGSLKTANDLMAAGEIIDPEPEAGDKDAAVRGRVWGARLVIPWGQGCVFGCEAVV
jgi:hypothetical protein